jgi:hypothetical protein
MDKLGTAKASHAAVGITPLVFGCLDEEIKKLKTVGRDIPLALMKELLTEHVKKGMGHGVTPGNRMTRHDKTTARLVHFLARFRQSKK